MKGVIKLTLKKQNCWEYTKCGREIGGKMVSEFGVCRAATEKFFDGTNYGKNAGRICFAIAGTFSTREVDCSFAKKLTSCKDCSFFKTL
jgi:eukaryotic-like serine/threonine-protein kinase